MPVITLDQLGGRFAAMARQPISRQTWGAIGALVTAATVDRMERAVDPEGKAHKPLNPKYVLWKVYGTTSAAKAAGREAKRAANAKAGKKAPVFRNVKGGKRVGGHSPDIWLLTGESRRRTQVTAVTDRSVTITINTPYSGYADAERQVTGVSVADVQGIHAILAHQQAQQFTTGAN